MAAFRNLLLVGTWIWPAATQSVLHDPATAAASYDYVIAGGGLTGLVVASRLTEDPKTSVLVIEYGDLAADSWNISMPYYANFLQDASLMFATPSVPQRGLWNRVFNLPLVATVGGGSTVNGMAYVRGARVDYNTWEGLGNRGWGWDGISQSSTLNVPSREVVQQLGYTFDRSIFGHGPAQAALAPWQWPDAWTDDLGYPTRNDGNMNGELLGLTWSAPISADGNLTRCSARKGYYDPIRNRPNLQLLVNSYVAKVQIRESTAKGVEVFSRDDRSKKTSISAKKELSGIRPRDLLERLGIPVIEDLPGVGANFMDHPTMRGLSFRFNNANPSEYMANHTGPLTAAHGNSWLCTSLHNLTAAAPALITSLITSLNGRAYLPAQYANKPTLLAGYAAQLSLLTRVLVAGTNWSGGVPGIGVTMQKPLSRGTVLINSTDPHPGLSPPLVDFNALTHPFDARVAVLALKLVRTLLLTTPSMDPLQVEELAPGPSVQADSDIEAVLRTSLLNPTNAHPCGTAGMTPRELGGVVDDQLRVYGVERLRVVDASVLPVIVAANLQVTMYAVAEKAADLIKGRMPK
ncbi:oxygen-dependent choline dehydrogenase [Staphylotrichum tortipilum]|uniref:Oxygen-dependent choline dehydrogenase n=1 Tax=Staphylotrichum tortipilum TaxID=2831512 RepID=A0AAN6MFT2_9PEZI|nr:oxygen-dependent choline dehydrogenase [Staphylotrichum longicolle]